MMWYHYSAKAHSTLAPTHNLAVAIVIATQGSFQAQEPPLSMKKKWCAYNNTTWVPDHWDQIGAPEIAERIWGPRWQSESPGWCSLGDKSRLRKPHDAEASILSCLDRLFVPCDTWEITSISRQTIAWKGRYDGVSLAGLMAKILRCSATFSVS